MSKANKKLQQAIDEGEEVTTLKSGALSLKSSLGRIAIANAAGGLTKLGKEYYKRTGKERPKHGFDPAGELVRDGSKEYVVMKNGKRKLARSWDPVGNQFKYTRTGKKYMKEREEQEEFIIHLPVTVKGVNKKTGKAYTREGMLPHEALSLGELKVPAALDMKEQEKKTNFKCRIETPDLFEIFSVVHKNRN